MKTFLGFTVTKARALLVPVVLLAISGAAFAAAASGPFSGIDTLQRWLKGGFYVGTTATARSENKVTKMLATRCDHDFPSVGAATATGLGQLVSNPCTLTGAALNDPCSTSTPSTLLDTDDGGTSIVAANFSCFVSAANTVKVRFHPAPKMDGGDGVSFLDPLDAGFTVRVTSSQ